MAIDNLKGGTKRTADEESLDNLRGGTKRTIQVNSIDNSKGGVKRVYVVGGGGGSAVINPLNVTPSTTAQTITASGGVDGYSPVNVSAVDSSIDANITAANIKKDVSILGVTGTYEGATPTGTMYIISNGTYNVADKAIANVNVPTTAPALYLEYEAVDGYLTHSTTTSNIINTTGVTDLAPYALAMAYYNNTQISTVNFSSITTIRECSLAWAFAYSSLTSINLSGLTEIPPYNTTGGHCMFHTFDSCAYLTSVDFSNLETIGSSSISGNAHTMYMFNQCTALTTITFTKLLSIGAYGLAYAFSGTSGLNLYFPAITTTSLSSNALRYSGSSATNITYHFPSNVQTQVEAQNGYSTTAPFSATSGTVLFDLPATE